MLAQRRLVLRTARKDDVAQSDCRERQAANCFAQHRAAWYEADFQDTAHALDFSPSDVRDAGSADTHR